MHASFSSEFPSGVGLYIWFAYLPGIPLRLSMTFGRDDHPWTQKKLYRHPSRVCRNDFREFTHVVMKIDEASLFNDTMHGIHCGCRTNNSGDFTRIHFGILYISPCVVVAVVVLGRDATHTSTNSCFALIKDFRWISMHT